MGWGAIVTAILLALSAVTVALPLYTVAHMQSREETVK